MVVDTMNPSNNTGTGRGKAKQILADAASIEQLRASEKNTQVSVPVHPRLYAHIVETLAKDEGNLEGEDGKVSLKRNSYANAVRRALATGFSYDFKSSADLVLAKRGNAGLVAVFKTTVQSMFELARSIGQMANMSDDQIKGLAFAKAKESVTTHPQLSGVDVSDDLLEALWSGADIEIDDDDDDDDEPETPNQPAQPAFA